MPLRNRPKLKAEDAVYLAAFQTLDQSRTMSMSGPNPITLGEVSAFCWLTGIASADDKSKYLRITQKLDQVFLKHWADNNKNKA